MKHFAIALALTLVLTGALTACDRKDTMADRRLSADGTYTGQVSRQYGTSGKAWDYLDDAHYTAGHYIIGVHKELEAYCINNAADNYHYILDNASEDYIVLHLRTDAFHKPS